MSRIWFEENDDGRLLYAEMKGSVAGAVQLGGLSGSERVRLLMGLGILAADRLSETYPTMLILDSGWVLDDNWLGHYAQVLSSPRFGFQTLLSISTRDIDYDALRWAGWKVVQLKGKAPETTISDEIRTTG